MKLFGEIIKVEAQADGAIKVIGVASTGATDEADERVLPEAMKAALPAYMRFGALREMHGMSAAGATLSAQVGEDGVTRIEAHVVDPLAVKKVQLGVYKGFSIGGKVLARDPADRKIITKLRLNEISLVDRPCNPEAVVEMWKADHAEAPDAPTNAEVIAKAVALAAAAGRPGRHTEFVVKAREALIREADSGGRSRAGRVKTRPCRRLRLWVRPPSSARATHRRIWSGSRRRTTRWSRWAPGAAPATRTMIPRPVMLSTMVWMTTRTTMRTRPARPTTWPRPWRKTPGWPVCWKPPCRKSTRCAQPSKP